MGTPHYSARRAPVKGRIPRLPSAARGAAPGPSPAPRDPLRPRAKALANYWRISSKAMARDCFALSFTVCSPSRVRQPSSFTWTRC